MICPRQLASALIHLFYLKHAQLWLPADGGIRCIQNIFAGPVMGSFFDVQNEDVQMCRFTLKLALLQMVFSCKQAI